MMVKRSTIYTICLSLCFCQAVIVKISPIYFQNYTIVLRIFLVLGLILAGILDALPFIGTGVPDSQMQRFIAVSGTYDDHLLYFQPDELNLSKGTKVRITGGEFEGQEGIFLKVKGARDRRVVIEKSTFL